MKKYLLSTIIFLLPAFTFAQNYLPPLVTLPMPAGSLMHMETYCITEDRFGNKYVGTDYGINIYDGSGWTHYGYPATFNTCCIYGIAFDNLDNTWIGTNAGVYIKDTNNIWSTASVPFSACSDISIDHQGNKWFMGYTFISGSNFHYELARFDGANWVRYDSTNTPAFVNQKYKMQMDQNDNIWLLGLTTGGIIKFDGANWTTYTSIDFGGLGPAKGFTIDQAGIVWAVLSDGIDQQLLRFDGNTFTIMPDPNMTFLFGGGASTYFFTIDKWGNKWITNDIGILYKYDGSDFTQYIDTVHFGFDCIKAFGDNIWMTTSVMSQDTNIYLFNERGCNQIKGHVYLDANADNIFQPNEQILPNLMLRLMPQNEIIYSNSAEYILPLLDSLGSYTLEILPPLNWVSGNPIQNISQTYFGEITDSIDFGIHAVSNSIDVSISFTNSRFRPGFNANTWINYKSNSASPISDTITFIKDPLLTYVSSFPSPVLQNGDTIKWYYSNLLPFESRMIRVDFLVPTSAPLGSSISMFTEIHPTVSDTIPVDNFYSLKDTIRGSFDPNSKEVNQDGSILPTQKLEYTLRFQNTGSDTAFTIVLHDTISSWLDISNLEIMGFSHPVTYEISDRAIIFTFSSILLPDSFVNAPLSHGFVKYSIEPVAGIPQGTSIENVAAIYFDYNLPVLTNKTTNNIDYFLSTENVVTRGFPEIFPNPATEKINIPVKNSLRFKIFNVLGEIVLEGNTRNNKDNIEVDIHELLPGVYLIKVEFQKDFVISRFIKQ